MMIMTHLNIYFLNFTKYHSRAAISKDKLDIVTDSEKKSDMIRQLKSTLTDAKTNLERAR